MLPFKLHRLLVLAIGVGSGLHPVWAGAGPIELGAPNAQDWKLTSAGAFAATQFSLVQLYGDDAPELLAYGREALGEGQSSIVLFETEAPQGARFQWNFPLYQGGLAGTGDLEGDGDDELIFWRYDEQRQCLRYQVERLRLTESGTLAPDTLLVCAELPARHESLNADRLPRSHAEGGILRAEERLVVAAVADFNWRVAPRAILVYDFTGGLRHPIRVPNNVFGFRFADFDGDGRRDIFLACYASDNGDSCARGTDGHSYWRVIDLEDHDLLAIEAGGPASLAVTQPLRQGREAPLLVLASLGDSSTDELRLYDARGTLVGLRRLPHPLTGMPLVFDRENDGADEVLVGLADGTLFLFDARLEQLAERHFTAAVQPLRAGNLRGDLRPECFLRVGDQLIVTDAAFAPRAVWSGSLTGRLRHPRIQTALWQSRDGEPRFAAVGLVRRELGFLSLEPNRRLIWAALVGGLLGSLLLLAVAAIAALWLRNRSLEARHRAWRDACLRAREAVPDDAAAAGARAQVAWQLLAEQLRPFAHSNGEHSSVLNDLHRDLERLEADDSAEHRQQVLARAERVRGALSTLSGVAPAAGALLGDDPVLANLETRLARLTEALERLARGADPADLAGDRQLSLGPLASGVQRQLKALKDRVDDCLRGSAFSELHAALQSARARTGELQLEFTLDGALDGFRLYEFSPSALDGLLADLLAIARSCGGPAETARLRLSCSVQRENLRVCAELPAAQDGAATAALWADFQRTHSAAHREPRRNGGQIELRLPLRRPRGAARAARAAGAGGGLLLLFAILLVGPSLRAEAAAQRFPLAAQERPQLLCADLAGDGLDETLVLLRRGPGAGGWRLLEWDGATGHLDSSCVAPDGVWRLLAAADLDRDGFHEPLLIRQAPAGLELWRRPGPVLSARPLELVSEFPLSAVGVQARPSLVCALRWLPAARCCVVLAGTTDGETAAELNVFTLAPARCWRQTLPGRTRLEDVADLNGDGNPDILLSVDAGGSRSAMPRLDSCRAWSLDLELSSAEPSRRVEASGDSGSCLRRQLLREERGPLLGELRVLTGGRGGDSLEFRPRSPSATPARLAGWKLLAWTPFDRDGDGRQELAVAARRPGASDVWLHLRDRALNAVDSLGLEAAPLALSGLDCTGDGIDDLLVLLPRKVLVLDRELATLAELELTDPSAGDCVQVERVRRREGVALAALTADALLFSELEPEQARARWHWLLLAFATGLAAGASLPKLRRRLARDAGSDWRPQARLLGLLLDCRQRERRGEGLAELRAGLARGEESAAALLGKALPDLLAELRQLHAAWAATGRDRRGCAELQRLLEHLAMVDASEPRAPLAAQLARLAGRLRRLESQLAPALRVDPIAVFRPTLVRCQGSGQQLDCFSFRLRGGEIPPVFFDPTQLAIVFENLIGNALRAMAAGGPRRLSLELEPLDGELRLLLEDSGPGVSPAFRERCFDLGVSGHGGTGSGLFIVRGLLAEFGGSIRLLEEVGPLGGARFDLRLRRLD